MERLTFEGNFCEIAKCEGEYRMTSECADGACSQRKVWERLKAYEDTGLEPEEIREVQAALAPIPFGRFRDIMEAERAGRLVVLNEPRRSLVWPDKTHNVVLCPNCNHDLMGGFELSDAWMMFQCPFCGQPIDVNRAVYAEQTESVLEGGVNHDD